MARFDDIVTQDIIDRWRREDAQAYRQRVIDNRIVLADRLDRMISVGDCESAKLVAARAGYRDIREGVNRTCEARQSN